ncbi:peroxide stress protein YaaA [Polymorphobacter sp. PAMC 29334]|uniref:peroxide stress protein YaaA n=1 Tax=Polymorphobacter sp. PAMC 29334 TaxID=2862331 RepID=UPI001C779C98|nr:peroxide stress protein YaaA [Polymorphobacter sp. PAMC 29334]QYE34320.1 peroxide stress protein YaaA [Polymorphobacter sp. PAMC 29334]
MLAVLSPAKTLDLETPVPALDATEPRFIAEAERLAKVAAKLRPSALRKLMHISEALAELNAARFKAFEVPFTPENARPALYTFDGDVYSGLDGPAMTAETVDFAQDHIRILSGLYGVLRPLDLMQAYRLEMGIKLPVGRTKTLVDFWGDRIAKALAEDLADHDDKTLINLASVEYFDAVAVDKLPGKVIAIDFRDNDGGALRFNTFIAKKARGAMARYMCDERLDHPDGLKHFTAEGYKFDARRSDDERWTFIRAKS